MPKILVVEDHPKLLATVTRTLGEAGHQVIAASSLQEARQSDISSLNLIILDLMLTDGDGLVWLEELRNAGHRTPVLILTARDSINDRVKGLDKGADDYLVKPFALDELHARIRALLRRDANPSAAALTVADLTINLLNRTASRGPVRLELQNRQFELLAFLMRHVNQIVTREMISHEIWKDSTTTWTNVIDVHINQLRKELERAGGPPLLHTIRGKGYRLGEST